MTDVAEEVGFTKGGLYHHVNKKEDLLVLIHNQIIQAFLREYKIFISPEDGPKEQLFGWIGSHLNLMNNYKAHIKILFTELNNLESKADLDRIVRRRDEIFQMLYNILKNGVKSGAFRNDINPKIATFLIFGMLNWFYQWYDPNGPRSKDNIRKDIEKLITGGLLKQSDARTG